MFMVDHCGKIGVLVGKEHESAVAQFFEFFKVPWEYYCQYHDYQVVLVGKHTAAYPHARLLIVYRDSAEEGASNHGHHGEKKADCALVTYGGRLLPIFTGMQRMPLQEESLLEEPILKIAGSGEVVGTERTFQGKKVVHLSYNLFDEVDHLLSKGQHSEYALTPTLDVHVSMIRNWIHAAGMATVEIPPSPIGHSFIVCLTHDVDFMRVKDHGLDMSVAGHALRLVIPRYIRNHKSEFDWKRIASNWKSLLLLPGVYLGLTRDSWFDHDLYAEYDERVPSTFFYVPYKGMPGRALDANGDAPKRRSVGYDVKSYAKLIQMCVARGSEAGLHGIDAWCDPNKASDELEVIRSIAGSQEMGVRMHWLYFHDSTPSVLERAGFLYDSTLGYNDAVGYRSGTTQAYQLPGTASVYELPLNVMDTSMFYRDRMGMSECQAMRVCERILGDYREYGGVLTVNWHTRSLVPERNWGGFYRELVSMLRAENPWFATAGDAVKWYRKRRRIRFKDVSIVDRKLTVRVAGESDDILPNVRIRVSFTGEDQHRGKGTPQNALQCIDIPWSGRELTEYCL